MTEPRTIAMAVRALSNQIHRFIHARVICCDTGPLTGMQIGVIRYLFERLGQQDIFQRDIEDQFHIRRSTATGVLQLMEKNGLIKRLTVDYDARLKRIELTDKGFGVYQEATVHIRQLEHELSKGLTRDELETFFRVTDKMLNNIS